MLSESFASFLRSFLYFVYNEDSRGVGNGGICNNANNKNKFKKDFIFPDTEKELELSLIPHFSLLLLTSE